jgi:hypothetical protein
MISIEAFGSLYYGYGHTTVSSRTFSFFFILVIFSKKSKHEEATQLVTWKENSYPIVFELRNPLMALTKGYQWAQQIVMATLSITQGH